MDVRQLIEHASRCKLRPLSSDVRQRFMSFARVMNSIGPMIGNVRLNIFSFHVNITGAEAVIAKVDVQRDNRSFDYQAMAAHLSWSAGIFCEDPPIWFVTDQRSETPRLSKNLRVVPLELDRDAIMFERVVAMCAYVHSDAFDRDTVFLDTDAFPNADLSQVFDGTFDVAVTYRLDGDLMPLNEGAIFASHADKPAVQRFFLDYLRTFEALCADETVTQYYGGIKEWRGGQLSLNALALPPGWKGCATCDTREGVRLSLLPCEIFNFTPDETLGAESFAEAVLDQKMIVHLKGRTKIYFTVIEQYQRARAKALPCSGQDAANELVRCG